MSIFSKSSELVLRRLALRLPIEDTFAPASGLIYRLADDTGKLPASLLQSCRVVFIDIETGLHYHDIRIELLTDMTYIGNTICDCLLFIITESSVKSPIRIQ